MTLEEIRRRYAETVCAAANVPRGALAEALARVPRERFVGPGPWQIAQPFDPKTPYRGTPDASLEHIYEDVVIAIDIDRQLNNGQPSGHARWIAAAAPRPGDSVLHIGCGTGYYTAIFAEIVGESGRVTAFEVDANLANRAAACLAPWPHARVEVGDAAEPKGPYDVLYVNAGATHARKGWLSSMAQGGRMLLPLTVHLPNFPHGVGFVLCIERRGHPWPTRFVSPVGIFDCVGAREDNAEAQLRKLLAPGGVDRIHAVSIEPHEPSESCLVHVDGFCLRS